MTGDSAGSADVSQKPEGSSTIAGKETSYVEVTTINKTKGSTQECSVYVDQSPAPPPVERYVVPKRPAVVPVFDISDFPMTLPGLPSSTASSPATTLAPETPRVSVGRLPSATSSPKPMGLRRFRVHLPSQKHGQESRCRLRLTQSCEKLRRREPKEQPTNSGSMMRCCPPSSNQSLRTQFQTAQSGFIPQERRTAWGVTFQRLLTLGHCQTESRMTS